MFVDKIRSKFNGISLLSSLLLFLSIAFCQSHRQLPIKHKFLKGKRGEIKAFMHTADKKQGEILFLSHRFNADLNK